MTDGCPAVWLTMDTHEALLDAERQRDPLAYQRAAAEIVPCTLGKHDGHDHRNDAADIRWNDEPLGDAL